MISNLQLVVVGIFKRIVSIHTVGCWDIYKNCVNLKSQLLGYLKELHQTI